jgi:hypothetical protein
MCTECDKRSNKILKCFCKKYKIKISCCIYTGVSERTRKTDDDYVYIKSCACVFIHFVYNAIRIVYTLCSTTLQHCRLRAEHGERESGRENWKLRIISRTKYRLHIAHTSERIESKGLHQLLHACDTLHRRESEFTTPRAYVHRESLIISLNKFTDIFQLN